MFRIQPSSLHTIYSCFFFLSFSLCLSYRGPPQEEAPALTNSNVQHPRPPPTRTQGPSSLSLRYPHQPSPWFSPCPPRQLCRSTQHSSLPPSLNATPQSLSLRVSAPTECHDATATAASIINSSGSEVSYSLPTPQKNQLQKFSRGEKRRQRTLSEASRLPNPRVALLNFS